MPSTTTDVATRFVNLVLKYGLWNEVKTLPADEMQVLFDIVSAAGFNPKQVAPGKLVGNYCDQDGSSTGKTYPINSLSPFKVVDQADGDHYFATGWLNCAFRRVICNLMNPEENRGKFIEAMTAEIERSVPLTPIQLTLEGDLLCEYPPIPMFGFGYSYFVDHTRDDRQLSSCVGIHKYCNGWMDRMGATATHNAIVCRRCYLRILFPQEITTYGELRQALTLQHTKNPA